MDIQTKSTIGTHPVGIGSYAYRYSIGFQGFRPPQPMTVFDFLSEAHALGLQGVQFCENLAYSDFTDSEFDEIKTRAEKLGLFLELGMKDLSKANLGRHLEIAERLSSRFLRIVLGENSSYRENDPESLTRRSIDILQEALPDLQQAGVVVGIENHFDLPTEHLVRIAEEIADKHVGLIFDTTNCLGFIKTPEETLNLVGPHLVSIHLKDYFAHKVEAGYLIRGAVLGEGWLRLKEILRAVFAYNPSASIILEMTIRREAEQSIDETILWEKQAIQQSVQNLRDMFSQIQSGQ